MCGLFAFAGATLDPAILRLIAALAGTRGPHAWGFVAWAPDRLRIVRHPGPVVARLDALADLPRDVRIVVGAARLATMGDWRDERNNQPHLAGGLALVHNGNCYDARQKAAAYGLGDPPNDTAVLAHVAAAIARTGGRLTDTLDLALARLGGDRSPQAVIAADGERLAAVARGQPLWQLSTDGHDAYLCSRPFPGALPLASTVEVTCPAS